MPSIESETRGLFVPDASPYQDEHQQRWVALQSELSKYRGLVQELTAEARALRVVLIRGICEHCGQGYTRKRPTARYCSIGCLQQHGNRRHDQQWDLALIAKHLDAIGLLMSQPSVDVLKRLVAIGALRPVAQNFGYSHQRISQIAIRANKLARFAEAVTLIKAAPASKGDDSA